NPLAGLRRQVVRGVTAGGADRERPRPHGRLSPGPAGGTDPPGRRAAGAGRAAVRGARLLREARRAGDGRPVRASRRLHAAGAVADAGTVDASRAGPGDAGGPAEQRRADGATIAGTVAAPGTPPVDPQRRPRLTSRGRADS